MTAFLALLAVSSVGAPAGALHVRLGVDNTGKCTATWNGEPVDLDGLLTQARASPDKKARVHVEGNMTAPYRCFGGAIYRLQMAGFTAIGFTAERPAKAAR